MRYVVSLNINAFVQDVRLSLLIQGTLHRSYVLVAENVIVR